MQLQDMMVKESLPSADEILERKRVDYEISRGLEERLKDKKAKAALFGSSWDDDTSVQIKFYDDRIITQYVGISIASDIWVEDEIDICFQIFPKQMVAQFSDFELARAQINRVMRRVFEYVPDSVLECDFFGYRVGEIVHRQCDPTDKGRDMFSIRALNLAKRPNAADYVMDSIVMFDRVLSGTASPV